MIFKIIKEIDIDEYTFLKKDLYVDIDLSELRYVLYAIHNNKTQVLVKLSFKIFNSNFTKTNPYIINAPKDFHSFFEESTIPAGTSSNIFRKMALFGRISNKGVYSNYELGFNNNVLNYVINLSNRNKGIVFCFYVKKHYYGYCYYVDSTNDININKHLNGVIVCNVFNGLISDMNYSFFDSENKFVYNKILNRD